MNKKIQISVMFIGAMCFSDLTSAADGNQVQITILGTSDIHGRFMPWDYAADREDTTGSLSQIATKVDAIRQETENVILVDAGDTIQGNFVETFKNDAIAPMMLGFNQMAYDVWVLGNHEFDFGLKTLDTNLVQFKGISLGGNIMRPDGNPFLPGYTIIERAGVKIGVIGMDTPMTQEFAEGSGRLAGTTFTNPTQEVKKIIKEIESQVDALILVAHMGLDNENDHPDTSVTDIAKANPELDAIVAGHMHTLVDKAVVNGVIITEPDKYGRALSRIDLQFEEKNGRMTLIDKNSFTYQMSDMHADQTMDALYQPYHDKLRENANRVIAQLSGSDLVPQNSIRGIPQVHIQDTGLSQLFHEACFHYAPLANVIALQIDNDNASLPIGEIKAKDIAYNYQYAGGEITVYQITGRELKAYMEWSADYFNQVKEGDVTYSFNPTRRSSKYSTNDFFGGLTYTIDLEEPAGQRIKNLAFTRGAKIHDDTEIRLGMNAYRMAHLTQKGGALEGQKFPILFDSQKAYGEEAGTIRQMTVRYLADVKQGKYEGMSAHRWQLTGLKNYQKARQIVAALINNETISVPTSADGRYTNIASINVKKLIFTTQAELDQFLAAQQAALINANDTMKTEIQRNSAIARAINTF